MIETTLWHPVADSASLADAPLPVRLLAQDVVLWRDNFGQASDDELRAFQDTIFMQDQPVLESQRPKLLPIRPQSGSGEVHSAADRSSAAYRRFLSERGIPFGVTQ